LRIYFILIPNPQSPIPINKKKLKSEGYKKNNLLKNIN